MLEEVDAAVPREAHGESRLEGTEGRDISRRHAQLVCAASIPRRSSTVAISTPPTRKNSSTVATPARCDLECRGHHAEQNRTHERRHLPREGEEAEELGLLVLRNEAGQSDRLAD